MYSLYCQKLPKLQWLVVMLLAPSIIITQLAIPHLQTRLPNFPQIIGQMALSNAYPLYTPDMKLSVIW